MSGWRSTAFPCDPGLSSAMRKAAEAAQAEHSFCWVEQLWIGMLRQLGEECSLADDQQRANLTQLVQQRPQALPPWLLASQELHAHLAVEGDEVLLQPRLTFKRGLLTWCARQDRAAEQQQQLERLCGAGEELLASAATSRAASTGFLLLQPPLPTQLLAQADAASMLALAQVCRGLRCASFELLRREHACLHGIHCAKGPAPPPYVPLQHQPAQQQQQQQRQQRQQQRPCRVLEHCRVGRALSLLCGSPEAAARHALQRRAGRSSTSGDVPPATVDHIYGQGADRRDVFMEAFELIPPHLVTHLVICQPDRGMAEPYGCQLFWVKAEHLPQVLQLLEDSREGGLAAGGQQGAGEVQSRELERLLEEARSAARLGADLCLLHTEW